VGIELFNTWWYFPCLEAKKMYLELPGELDVEFGWCRAESANARA